MLIHYWLFNALTGGHGQKHYDVKHYDSWKRKITRENERERGSFTFNYSIAHCVGDGGGKRKRERDGDEETGGEPGSSFKIETSSENKHTNVRRQQ